MTGKEKKIVKVSPALHREIDIESATTGKPIYAIVEEAWALYKGQALSSTPEVVLGSMPIGEKLTPPEGNFGIYFESLLISSVLNSKLDAILEILNEQAHGEGQNRADRRRSLERQVDKFIKDAAQTGRRVAAPGKPGKRVRGRSTGNVPPLRTGSD